MKIKRKKYTVLVVALVALAVAALCYWYFSTGDTAKNVGADGVNYSPATDDDKKLNDQHKQDLPGDSGNDQAPQTPTSTSEKKSVKPVVSAWGQPAGPGTDFKLNGFVDGIIESDGKCTLTLTKDSSMATVTKGALRNAQNTSCGQLVIPYTELTPGTWQAVLSYSSPSSEGKSDQTPVEVK